jgi:hypothetical protein
MISVVSQRVKNKNRSCFHSARGLKRVNDNNLKIPMIPIDVNGKKQYVFGEWIFDSCMPFFDSVQSVPSSDTSLVIIAAHNCTLPTHIFSRKYVLKAEMWWEIVNFSRIMLQACSALVPMLPIRAASTHRIPNVIKSSFNHRRGCSLLMSSDVKWCLMGAVPLGLSGLRSISAQITQIS